MTTEHAPADSATVDLPQGRLAYRTAGPAASNHPPVVLVHGLLVDARLWEPVAERLASAGIRSYAPTLPLGSHRQPMNADADLSPAGVARLVLDFIQALGLSDVTIAGNDTGGAICQIMLAGDTSRISAAVLTNCDALGTFPPRSLAPLFRALRHPGLVAAMAPALRSKAMRNGPLAYGPLSSEPLDSDLTLDWVQPLADEAVRRDLAKLARGVHPRVLLDAASRFGQFTGPVRVLWGEADSMFRLTLGRQLAEAFPHATLATVPAGRTFLPLDAPDRVADEIITVVRDARQAHPAALRLQDNRSFRTTSASCPRVTVTVPAAGSVAGMRVRIGISLGTAGVPGEFEAAVGLLESAGVDSLWLPENVYGPTVEPFTGMTYALAKTTRLKVGSGISVLPGRHPVLVAKQLASLAGLAPGRVLPVFGLQPALAAERALFPVPPGQRGAVFDEALTLLRLVLTSDEVTFHGSFFTVDGASAGPLPAKPLDIWLGGSAPAGLRRVGRLADGWLGSLLTPAEARAAVATINAAADEAGREVEQDHFGTSLAVAFGGIPDALAASIRRRRPDADPASLVADGWAGAREMISAHVEAGLSKFVIRPAAQPAAADGFIAEFIAEFARELMPLQT